MGVLWVSRVVLGIHQDGTLITLLLLPALIYLAFSGRLRELKAGPLEAKLTEPVMRTPVMELQLDAAGREVIQKIEAVIKGPPDQLPAIIREMEGAMPPVLYLHLGTSYTAPDIEEYLRNLAHFRGFKFVVIAHPDGRIVGYIPYYILERILKLPERAQTLLDRIAHGDVNAIRQHLDIRTTFITAGTTNRKALQLMLEDSIEALIVLDDQGQLRGIVEREQLVARILLSLAE